MRAIYLCTDCTLFLVEWRICVYFAVRKRWGREELRLYSASFCGRRVSRRHLERARCEPPLPLNQHLISDSCRRETRRPQNRLKCKKSSPFILYFSRLALPFTSCKVGCGSEIKIKVFAFYFVFLSPCTTFCFAQGRLRLGRTNQKTRFLLCSSLALHYLSALPQGRRHLGKTKQKQAFLLFCARFALPLSHEST